MNNKGQIGIWTAIITTVGSIFAAGIVGYFSKTGSLSSEIETVKAEQVASTLEISQRVTKVETDTVTMKDDIKEIKSDVKSLIKLLK